MVRRLLPILIPLLMALAVAETHAQRLAVSPRTLVFPCTVDGNSSALPITLTNNGTSSLRVQRFVLSPGSPFIAPPADFTIPPGQQRQVIVRFLPTAAPALWRDELRIITPSDQQLVTLLGESSPPPGLWGDLQELDFRNVAGSDTAERCIVLENYSCTPVELTQLWVSSDDFRLADPPPFPYILRKGEPLRICVQLLPGPQGNVNGRVEIETRPLDDPPRNRSYPIPLRGRRTEPGLTMIPPRGLNFGEVPVNVISAEQRIGLTNPGPLPVRLEEDWELTGNNPGEFIIYPPQFPAQLRPRGTDTIWFRIRFAPSSEGPKQADLRIGPSTRYPILGTGVRNGLGANPLNLDAGEHLAGISVTLEDTLRLRNSGTARVEIIRWDISGASDRIFAAAGPASLVLEPGESVPYDIIFTPAAVERYAATLTFYLSDGSLLPVRLSGAGVAQERYRFWVDSALADVNQPFDLHLRTSPDLRGAEGITSYSITLRFSPTALYLHRATAPDGTESTITFLGKDTAVIRHTGNTPLSGPVLATFSMEGLVSGLPWNTVELIEVALGGDTSRGSIRGDGAVALRGCDIGYGVGFGRPVVARGVWPAPASDRVTIRYIAPVDARPQLRVTDVTGRQQDRGELPAGTGSEQEATVDLGDLEPGFYFLELRSGSGRSAVPVVIAR